MNYKKYVSVLMLLSFFVVKAQEKKWEINLKETLYEVGWIEQTNDGLIIASGAKGLLALDNNSGEILWHNKELKSVNKNSFLNISNLPLFYVEFNPLLGKNRGLIINSNTGAILFDTKDDNYKIKGYTLLPENGMILFELIKEKVRYVMNFSLKTWEKEWITPVGKDKSKLLKRLYQGFTMSSFLSYEPQFDNQGNMIIGIDDTIYVLKISDGTIAWNYEAKNDIKALVYSSINNNLYAGIKKSNRLTIFNPATGEDITPGKLKLRGYMIDLVKGNSDDLILIETEGFNIIDPKTNEFRWKKSFKIEPLSQVINLKDGYIAIGKDEKNGVVAKVNLVGKKVWDTKIKGYSYYVTLTDKGVLYISTDRANILDYNKGNDVWKRDVKFRSIPAVTYDEDENKVILFENKKAYKFDLKTGDINLFSEDISLEKVSRKTPLEAQYIASEGYFIFSDQNLSLLTKDGKLKYSHYFKPPSSNDALFALGNLAGNFLGVDLDIQGSIQNINTLTDMSNGVFTETLDQNGVQEKTTVSGLYVGTDASNMQAVFEISNTRYYNSKNIKSHQFVVTKVTSDTAPTKHQILMINKRTGNVDKEIDLLDKTPNYLIDQIDNRVFVNENNHLISCYEF